MEKIVVICGPTCTGKTSLGIKLCQKFSARGGGEIVSADSRQIYKFMDIGTGKTPVPKSQISNLKSQKALRSLPPGGHNSNVKTDDGIARGDGYWVVDGVYIHLYDVVEPDRKFSVARFKDAATREIESMWRRGKVPFLVGGTGFYLAAVLGEADFPRIAPDWKLRQELEKLSVEELFAKLQKLDPERAKIIDPKNPRRLVRAVEIALQQPFARPGLASARPGLTGVKIGLTAPRKILYQRADDWSEAIVHNGLLAEVQDLINRGYRNAEPMKGIIYQTAVEHLGGKIGEEEMLQRIKFDLHGYIRRQLTWFRRDKEIKWFDISKAGFDRKVEEVVESYLETNC
jgi:tRNA dimethylallyltransferase